MLYLSIQRYVHVPGSRSMDPLRSIVFQCLVCGFFGRSSMFLVTFSSDPLLGYCEVCITDYWEEMRPPMWYPLGKYERTAGFWDHRAGGLIPGSVSYSILGISTSPTCRTAYPRSSMSFQMFQQGGVQDQGVQLRWPGSKTQQHLRPSVAISTISGHFSNGSAFENDFQPYHALASSQLSRC